MVERGKPAEYGQEIVKRRARITAARVALTGRLVLDFGSGNGAQTLELTRHGCRIIACDVDSGNLEILRQSIKNHSITTITPTFYDGTLLPFADDYFDIVVSYAVLEHVPDEHASLSEIHRVLKERGECIISVPNRWWVFETHGARLPLLHWNRVPFFSWLPNSLHSRFANARIYRRKDIVRLLETHGFEIIDSWFMTAPMDMVKSPLLQRALRALIFRGDVSSSPFLSTEVFVHCRKA